VSTPDPAPANTISSGHTQAWIVSALAVVGTVVLAALGKSIPDALLILDGSAVTAGAALSLPRGT